MVTIHPGVLIFFVISCLISFAVPFLKDGVLKQLTHKAILASLVPFIVMTLPFAALFGLAVYLSVPVVDTLPCFLGAATLTFLLSKCGLPPRLVGVLLGAAALILTMHAPTQGGVMMLSAALLGLVVPSVGESLLSGSEPRLDDILPALFWLSGVLWIQSSQQTSSMITYQNVLLGIISVCLILRVMQGPFMQDDRILLKRVVLAASGGLAVLIVITKLVMAMKLTVLALLVGTGLFATYLFLNMDAEGQHKVSGITGIKMLIVIGMFELVATRFFGMYGLVALAPVALVARRSGFAQYFGIFFAVRALLQVFIATYNENVTGINITHPYAGAALYAGLIAMAALTMLLREIVDRRLLAAVFLGVGAVVPMAANYYLHAEPTSSFLVAATAGAMIFAVLGPAFQQTETAGYHNVLLMPAMMITVATTFGGLIEIGNSATNETKSVLLLWAIGLTVICFVVGWFITRNSGPTKATVV